MSIEEGGWFDPDPLYISLLEEERRYLAAFPQAEDVKVTEEEERMLRAYRRYRSTLRGMGVFKWRTEPVEGVTITGDMEVCLIVDPNDLSEG